MPDAELVQRIPDDAFYYLVLARNFAATGRWTFDGSEPASGFHLLWGYLLALLFRIDPDASLHVILAIGSALQVGCLAVAATLLTRAADRLFGPDAWLGVIVVFVSASCLQQGTWLMEAPLVIASAAALLWMFLRDSLPLRPALYVGAACLGFVLMMARSDSGLLTLILLITHVALRRAGRVDRSMPRLAGWALAGSVLGLVAVLLHTDWISGQWVQASAQQKAFWTTVSGYSLGPGRYMVYTFFSPTQDATAPFTTNIWEHTIPRMANTAVRWLLLFCIAWATVQTIRSRRNPVVTALLGAMVAVIGAYVVLYGLDSAAVQQWYIANFTCPVALLAATASAYFMRRHKAAVAATASLLCLAGFCFSLRATMPWQEAMYRSGIYLRQHPEIRPVASFNAGIIGFFAGGGVINADGLVNDRILPYAKRGRLAEYFALRGDKYLLESPSIFETKMSLRGGYADGKLAHCIQSATDLFPDDPLNIYGHDHIRLYQFDPPCLSSSY